MNLPGTVPSFPDKGSNFPYSDPSLPDNPDRRWEPDAGTWAELERIAKPARERARLSPDQRANVLIALCACAPLSRQELAALLGRNEAYVSQAATPLVRDGRLAFLYPSQPSHPRQRYVAGPAAASANHPSEAGNS